MFDFTSLKTQIKCRFRWFEIHKKLKSLTVRPQKKDMIYSSGEDILDIDDDLVLASERKPLLVEIPYCVLSNIDLSLNEKLMYGLDYSFAKKLGLIV